MFEFTETFLNADLNIQEAELQPKRYCNEANIPLNTLLKVFVIKITDGDTIHVVQVANEDPKEIFNENGEVKNHYKNWKIRLSGIDAPETQKNHRQGQAFSVKATNYLSELIFNKIIYMKVLDTDPYGRLLCMLYVKIDGHFKNVNMIMLRAGLAVVYKGTEALYGGLMGEMEKATKLAQEEHLNVFSQDHFITPDEYKHPNKY
ncbi:LCL3 [Ecytonucleospora hepatopenaei]|uniref:LCL3 n=1 Tax=Ecytonucleospora hepatopenaei TaxID=646526 RepID=A0A1W0E8K7_9MICR|nr:hypothetical protein EHP00_2554 [Ecytonucleospora hepatopenaei]OQS55597.1 LCL3 [Ecytonucleospora hepatopenaei]